MKPHWPVLFFIFLLFSSTTFSQQIKPAIRPGVPQTDMKEDDPRYKKIDSLLNAGLPQSALQEVKKLMQYYSITHSGSQDPADLYAQFIKANLYELIIRSQFEEDYLKNYIAEREELLKAASVPGSSSRPDVVVADPVQSIIHSILADLYWQYYTQNRWVILDRSVRPDDDGQTEAPIDTWDVNKFLRKISQHYKASLQNRSVLQSISLKAYDPVLEKAEDSKKYRPTLFDFLAFRAAEFYMNDEASITSPVYVFVMNDPQLLSDAATFANLKIKSEDTLSFHFQALDILQQITRFHLQDKDPSALADAELLRLGFVHRNINVVDKDSLYLRSLEALVKKYESFPVSAKVMEALADWFMTEYEQPVKVFSSQSPKPKKADFIVAREWCLKAIQKYPDSRSANNCRLKLKSIEAPQIEFRIQQEQIPEKEFPILLQYKNLNKAYFRLLPSEYIPNREYYSDRQSMVKKLISLKPLKTWSADMPDVKDYQTHKTELIMPVMPAGRYILLALAKETLSENDSILSYSFIQISNMAYISRSAPDGSGLIYVLDRSNGKPLAGVRVQSFTTDYDYKTRKYSRRNKEKYVTGEDGSFTIKAPAANQNANLSFELNYKKETLIIENYYQLYNRGSYRDRESKITTFFFTDRAIYRPGQPVYFKGIVVDKSGKSPVVVPGHRATVRLFDVNGQNISTQELTSNEYGSFSGSFVLPASMLTGSLRIESENGAVNFNVEEYKRPKFEVTFKPVDSAYRLNAPVEITGEAKTYTGVAVADALVNYRVVRSVVYPFRDVFFIWPPSRNPDAEIANGTIKTNADGSFKINFTALPDPDQFDDSDPLYTYLVYADVTDISGETRSAQTSINVSNKALLLETDMSAELNIKDLKPIVIKATNLAGKNVPAKVKVELYKIKEGEL
ncbi:MAG: MG2 domain-containing protein, partial [Chloroflexota bacterium]